MGCDGCAWEWIGRGWRRARAGAGPSMEVVSTWQGLPPALRGATVALGNFDGVHLGHAHVLRTAHTPPGRARRWRC